ncbi:hypothetical protein MASR2M78_27350 [Treponema sp.]
MGVLNVGIGEWAVSKSIDDVIKTYALGSCVAVIIYDAKAKVGGLIHVALPDSSIDAEKGPYTAWVFCGFWFTPHDRRNEGSGSFPFRRLGKVGRGSLCNGFWRFF